MDGGSARRKATTSTQTQNKDTQTSMPQVGFEPTTPIFGRPKTVHAFDRTITVIGKQNTSLQKYKKKSL
jgi:hypothetical protein